MADNALAPQGGLRNMAGNSASEIANPTVVGSFQRLRKTQQVGCEMWLIAVAR